jgi:hypothetical protein
MAGLLIIGAIPSGLAGTATNAGGLYAIRFFIGILGGSFVPCVAWTVRAAGWAIAGLTSSQTAFFDKKIVGAQVASLSQIWSQGVHRHGQRFRRRLGQHGRRCVGLCFDWKRSR